MIDYHSIFIPVSDQQEASVCTDFSVTVAPKQLQAELSLSTQLKVKDPWRSASQLVRGPQATRAANESCFHPPPPFFLPALDGREMTLRRVPYVLDKMGLYGAHLRFNEHVF